MIFFFFLIKDIPFTHNVNGWITQNRVRSCFTSPKIKITIFWVFFFFLPPFYNSIYNTLLSLYVSNFSFFFFFLACFVTDILAMFEIHLNIGCWLTKVFVTPAAFQTYFAIIFLILFARDVMPYYVFALMSFKVNNRYFVLLSNKCSRSRWSTAQYKRVHIWADIFPCIFFYHVFDMPHSVKAAVNIMKCPRTVWTLKSGIDAEDTDCFLAVL